MTQSGHTSPNQSRTARPNGRTTVGKVALGTTLAVVGLMTSAAPVFANAVDTTDSPAPAAPSSTPTDVTIETPAETPPVTTTTVTTTTAEPTESASPTTSTVPTETIPTEIGTALTIHNDAISNEAITNAAVASAPTPDQRPSIVVEELNRILIPDLSSFGDETDARNDHAVTSAGYSVTIAAQGNDVGIPKGAAFQITNAPSHGTATIENNTGVVFYVPADGFVGTDQLDYTIFDAKGHRLDTATVFIKVYAAPKAADFQFYILPGQTFSFDVSAGSSDKPGPANFYMCSDDLPDHGSWNSSSKGHFTYAPDAGWSGNDYFCYVLQDMTTGAKSIGHVGIYTSLSDAVDDELTTGEGVAVDSTVAGNDLFTPGSTFSLVTSTQHGAVSFHADGTYTFSPDAGYVGADEFSYGLEDLNGNSDIAVVHIDVTAAPTAVNDSASTKAGTSVGGDVSLNDTFVEGATFAKETNPAHGTANVNGDGTFSYAPSAGFTGTDSFVYSVKNPNGTVDVATVTITVAPVADVRISVGPTSAIGAGETQTVTFTVTNDGPTTTLETALMTYTPNGGFVVVSAPTGCTIAAGGSSVSCVVPVRNSGESASFAIGVKAPATLPGTDPIAAGTVTVTGGDIDPNLANNSASVAFAAKAVVAGVTSTPVAVSPATVTAATLPATGTDTETMLIMSTSLVTVGAFLLRVTRRRMA